MSPMQTVVQLAARQHGMISWGQAVSCGLTPNQISRRTGPGGWTRVLPGIYRLPGSPLTFQSRLIAVRLWLNGNGHFCSTTAAHLMQLDGIARPDRITVARTDGLRAPDWVRIKRLLPEQLPSLRNVNGYRVPVAERLLLELSAELPPRSAGLALDDALRRGMTDLGRMSKMLDEVGGRGRRGTRALRHMLRGRDLHDADVRTAFETAMLRTLKRIDGEAILPNHMVRVSGRTFYLDFYIPSARLGVECQSIRWHKGTDFLDKDMKRHRRISSLDIEILYFTWDDVMFTPDIVEREVRDAIVRRRALAR